MTTTKTWFGGNGEWTNGADWSPTGAPAQDPSDPPGADDIVINAGTCVLDGTIPVNGAGEHEADAHSVMIASGAGLTLVGAPSLFLDDASGLFTNAGTLTVDSSDGQLAEVDVGTFSNSGLVHIIGTAATDSGVEGATATNTGTIDLDDTPLGPGGGQFVFDGIENDGTINVGENANVDALGNSITGTGSINIDGGSVYVKSFSSNDIDFQNQVDFTGTRGTLRFAAHASNVAVSDFGAQDIVSFDSSAVDGHGVYGAYVTYTENSSDTGGTVLLTNVRGVALMSFNVTGSYTAANFTLNPNGATTNRYYDIGWTAGRVQNAFNGDRTSDLLFFNPTSNAYSDWTISGGAKAASYAIATSNPGTYAGSGDFTQNGTADLLFDNASTDQVGYEAVFDGASTGFHSLGKHAAGSDVVGVGDFNGDGVSDVLLSSQSGTISDWLVEGGARRTEAVLGTESTAKSWSVVGVGDYNGDGTSDVMFENANTHALLQWDIAGGHVQSQHGLGTLSATSKVVGTGDFNGDGTSDLLVESSTGYLTVREMGGDKTIGFASLGHVLQGYSVVDVGDYNGDGIADVSIYNATTRDTRIGLVSNGHIGAWMSVGQAAAGSHLIA